MGSPTMGCQDWGSSHRELQVERVENGYVVKAKFYRQRKAYDSSMVDSTHRKEFVFHSDAEMLEWVKAYFEASAEEIGKHDKET